MVPDIGQTLVKSVLVGVQTYRGVCIVVGLPLLGLKRTAEKQPCLALSLPALHWHLPGNDTDTNLRHTVLLSPISDNVKEGTILRATEAIQAVLKQMNLR